MHGPLRLIFLLIILALLWPAMASAQRGELLTYPSTTGYAAQDKTPAQKDADRKNSLVYYHRCMATLYLDYKPDVRESFCTCSAAHAQQNLTSEEIALLATGGKGLNDIKVKIDVMGPCLGSIIRQYEYDRYASSQAFKDFFRTDRSFVAAAHCMGDGMAELFDEYGREAMAEVQATKRRGVAVKDPLDDWLESFLYKKELGKIRSNCMNKYAFE